MKYTATTEGNTYEIEINTAGDIILDGRHLALDFQAVSDQPVYSMLLDGRSYQAHINQTDDRFEVYLRGGLYQVRVEDERQRRLRQASEIQTPVRGEYHLQAPMPGLIVDVPVEVGQRVEKGENLVILESMKMQNELRAPRAGSISRIQVKSGDNVDQTQILLTIV